MAAPLSMYDSSWLCSMFVLRVACFFSTKICIFHLIWHDRENELFRDACNWTRILILRTRKAMLRRGAWGFWTRIARITWIIFLRTRIFLVNAWCVGFLNTDFTDYTDYFSEDVDIPLGFVMRKVLNTDCTDYTDNYWGTRNSLLLRDGSNHG